MSPAKEIKRQAVVVIHGMGEQRPMETLRSFVTGVKSVLEKQDPLETQSTVRSKPDSLGDIYETVRLSMDSTKNRPITDFYEFYWAHNMRGTKFEHMFTWMKHLILSWVTNVPKRLQSLWYTVWTLILLLTGVVTFFSLKHKTDMAELLSINKDKSSFLAIAISILAFIFSPFILSLIGSWFKSIFLNSAGDAARYFSPIPDNISERSHIRQQGIKFLQKLHDLSKTGKVDRIIIVAHSLGTAVAYDFLRLLWTEYNYRTDLQPILKQENLKKINQYALNKLDINIDSYQDLQFDCWKEQKTLGNPWLISDFITLGAAIYAIDYFMVTNVPIQELKDQRELPCSPPIPDAKDKAIYFNKYPEYKVGTEKLKLLNHGALFAEVRWTNIYYSCDYVGGEMKRVFGKGIKDIEIARASLWLVPGGHTSYWDNKDKNNALVEIIKAMKLNY